MNDKVKGFKDFAQKPVVENTVTFNTPDGVETAEFPDTDGQDIPEDDGIPAIFATIHFKSDARPDGYTPEDIEEMNRVANQHLAGVKNSGDVDN